MDPPVRGRHGRGARGRRGRGRRAQEVVEEVPAKFEHSEGTLEFFQAQINRLTALLEQQALQQNHQTDAMQQQAENFYDLMQEQTMNAPAAAPQRMMGVDFLSL